MWCVKVTQSGGFYIIHLFLFCSRTNLGRVTVFRLGKSVATRGIWPGNNVLAKDEILKRTNSITRSRLINSTSSPRDWEVQFFFLRSPFYAFYWSPPFSGSGPRPSGKLPGHGKIWIRDLHVQTSQADPPDHRRWKQCPSEIIQANILAVILTSKNSKVFKYIVWGVYNSFLKESLPVLKLFSGVSHRWKIFWCLWRADCATLAANAKGHVIWGESGALI